MTDNNNKESYKNSPSGVGGMIGHFTDDDRVLQFINSNDLERLAPLGTSCPDHFLRTKISPLVLNLSTDEDVTNTAAIKEKIAADLAKDSVGSQNVYKVVDLFAEGNTAVEVGSFNHLDSAGKVLDKGFYMSYFQKKDGKYVCVRDMNVTTLPTKAPM